MVSETEMAQAGNVFAKILPAEDLAHGLWDYAMGLKDLLGLGLLMLALFVITAWFMTYYTVPLAGKFLPRQLYWPAGLFTTIALWPVVFAPVYSFILNTICNITGVCF